MAITQYTLNHERLDTRGIDFAVARSDGDGLDPVMFSVGGIGFHAQTYLTPGAAEYLAGALIRAATLARENAQVAA